METLHERLKRWLMPVLALILLGLAFEAMQRELRSLHWTDVATALHAVPIVGLILAVAATVVNFVALTFYDRVAFAYVGKDLPYRRIAYTSFLAYAVANSVGFATISGTSIRYRYYSRWGVTPGELSRVVVNYSTTFWLGLLVLSGVTLVLHPGEGAARVLSPILARAIGVAALALALAYAVLPFVRRRPVRLWRFHIPVPRPRIVFAQFAVSIVDWAACGAVLQFLLPHSDLPFAALLGSFLVAQLIALVSHVPGGIGVFESLMLLALAPYHAPQTTLAALLLFRIIYYLVPFAIAVVLIMHDELELRQEMLSRAFDGVTNVSQAVLPQLLAAVTFAMGCVLLLSGATPGEPARVEWLSRIVPLPAIEISHFLGSLIGVGLLLLSSGIWRRLDMAYYVTIALLAAGIFTTLVKGIDYEEAVLLALALVALIIARGWFDRRTHFFAWRLSPTWLASVLGAVATSLWLGGFAYRHVEYSRELWWQFEFDGDASRFLRASVGVGVALLVFTGRRLLTPAPPEVPLPSDGDLADAERIVSAQPLTNACLVFLRDKALLFDARRTGFIMYGVRGRTWVAMGDPVVADPGPAPELVRRFLERCDDFDGRPVFYEVGKERLHLYADFGLAFVKLGEEARVPLRTFGLEGSERKALRMAHRRVTSDGGTFRIVMPPEVDALLPELEEISVKWLRNKSAAEKGFSLGFFSRDYVRRFPVALIEREGRIEAFANVWTTADKGEVSTDLMRHRESPIRQLMDGLFVHLLLWGQAQGYEYFNLGMAPLSGLGDSPANTLWNRIASIVFEHGGRFYNFQGLRVYKQKFHPVWEPRYLVYSGRLTLAPILADVAALVAGGYRRMLFR